MMMWKNGTVKILKNKWLEKDEINQACESILNGVRSYFGSRVPWRNINKIRVRWVSNPYSIFRADVSGGGGSGSYLSKSLSRKQAIQLIVSLQKKLPKAKFDVMIDGSKFSIGP